MQGDWTQQLQAQLIQSRRKSMPSKKPRTCHDNHEQSANRQKGTEQIRQQPNNEHNHTNQKTSNNTRQTNYRISQNQTEKKTNT